MKKTHKRTWFFVVGFLLAIVAGLLIAEVALRLIGSQIGVNNYDIFAIPLDGNPHRRSAIPGLIWEMAPDVDTVFQQHQVRTNSWGFRDKDYGPKGKAQRIVSLGDSIAFGASVNQDEAYAKVLERLLNEEIAPGVEVINGGVSGYNMAQYATLYETKAQRYDPDLVLLGLFDDDFMPPYIPMEHKTQVALLQHSHLYRLLADRIDWLSPVHGSGQNTQVAKSKDLGVARLHKLKQQLAKENRSLVAIVHPDLQPGEYDPNRACANCEILSELKIDFIDMYPVYMKTGKPLVSFSINPKGDPHPNAKGHRLIAETIRDFLREHPKMLISKSSDKE